MHISKLTVIACMAGAVVVETAAQPASSDAHEKALELLRQTMSQQAQPAAASAADIVATPATAPVAPFATAAPGTVDAPALSSDVYEGAREVLRKAIADQAAQAATAASSRKTRGTSKARGGSPDQAKAATVTNAPAMTAAPEQPAGPKGKRERLAELLEEYKADKITPSEYHARRAQILAEP